MQAEHALMYRSTGAVGCGVMAAAVSLLCAACAALRPVIPEVFYRISSVSAPDTVCGSLAADLVTQQNLARDSSYEVPLDGSRCHEILYAADGNELWIQLRGDVLTIAVRYYPHPGDLEDPTGSTQALSDAAVNWVRQAYPGAVVTRGQERE
jgi:hypothetical protein